MNKSGLPILKDKGVSLLEQEHKSEAAVTECICMICGEEKEQGIRIITEFICAGCEAELVKTDVSDAKYPYFIHQLKRLWLRKHA